MVHLRVACMAFSALVFAAGLQSQTVQQPFDYNYTEEAELAARIDVDNPDAAVMRGIFARRRARVLQAMPEGAMLVFSVEWVQPRRLEFQVPDSDNHDFVFLTGIDGLASIESALLLVPTPEKNWEVLYTSGDVQTVGEQTGIEDVRPFSVLEEDFSVAMTDYRDWRITQIRRWPLPAALSKTWGPSKKVLHVNYPRFFRLGLPEPSRLELFERFRRFSPEIELRDAADVLDPVRMLHDAWGLANLRRAAEITHEGVVEGLSLAQPGMIENEVMEVVDFVYRYRGATLGFPTSVSRQPPGGRPPAPHIPEGFIQYVSRSGAEAFTPADLLHIDTGAAFNHYSADVQRTMPIDGTFDDTQRHLYEVALSVQKAVIESVRPGVTWWELHNIADSMLREAGGYDEYWTYGIGHFVGMEVHDEGDYTQPLQPGMVLAIEQGVAPPDGPRAALEDDVLVTEDGYEWITRSIPIEIDEVEALARRTSSFEALLTKRDRR